MSFSTKYFSGVVTGGDSQHNYTTGTFTALVTGNANNTLSGTWNYTGRYIADSSTGPDPYVLDGSGSIALSGSLTGSLVSGSSDSWKVFFASADARFIAGTYGFLDRTGELFDLDASIAFDLSFLNRLGQTITERFGAFNHDLTVSSLPPVISIDHYTGSVAEDGVQISVTLTRSGADLGAASSVLLTTEDGAARSSGSSLDFIAVDHQKVVFAAGVSSVTVMLDIIVDDTSPEPNENFGIVLSDPLNATLGFSSGSVSIVDNDLAGTSGNDRISGTAGNETIVGGGGNDSIDGGAGVDTAVYSAGRSSYAITKTVSGYTVQAKTGSDGVDTLTNIEKLLFSDVTVNLTIQAAAASISDADLNSLVELYTAYFNRVPDADGLNYWIAQFKGGMSLNTIGDNFYAAAVSSTYSGLTGYASTMSNADFVIRIYQNVLARSVSAADEGVQYWAGNLAGGVGRGSVVNQIVTAAHTFKGTADLGWVANLLDNKLSVGKTIAVSDGLTYISDGFSKAHDIAAAVTASDTAQAIHLIGVTDPPLSA